MSLPAERSASLPTVVLAIDPGSVKCGIAVVGRGDVGGVCVLHRAVVERERIVACALPLIAAHAVEAILMGDATGGPILARALRASLPPDVPVHLVNEAFSSQRARRALFRKIQRPVWRGWCRVVFARRISPTMITSPSSWRRIGSETGRGQQKISLAFPVGKPGSINLDGH